MESDYNPDQMYRHYHRSLYLTFTFHKLFKARGWHIHTITSMIGDPLDERFVLGVILADYSLDFVMLDKWEVIQKLQDKLNLAEFESVFADYLSILAKVVKSEYN